MNVWSCRASAFKAATNSKQRDLRVITEDPCVAVEQPGDRNTRKTRRKPFVYPKEAAAVFAWTAIPREWREVHAIAAYTYLRPGKLRALARGDVDLEAALVNVRKAWDYEAEAVKPPKTRNVVRRVPIEPALDPLLRRMREGKRPGDLLVPVLSPDEPTVTSSNRKASVGHHLRAAGVIRAELHGRRGRTCGLTSAPGETQA